MASSFPLIVSKCGIFLFPPHVFIFHPNCQLYLITGTISDIYINTLPTVPIIHKQGKLLIGYFSLYPQFHIQYFPQQNPIISIRNKKSSSFNFSHNDTMTIETIIIIIPSSIRPIQNYVYHRTETLCPTSDQALFPFGSDFWVLNCEAFCLYPFPIVHIHKYRKQYFRNWRSYFHVQAWGSITEDRLLRKLFSPSQPSIGTFWRIQCKYFWNTSKY